MRADIIALLNGSGNKQNCGTYGPAERSTFRAVMQRKNSWLYFLVSNYARC